MEPSLERIPKHFGNPDHYKCFALSGSRFAPVCAAAVASHLFIDGAATHPISGGELPPQIHS
jgi:hypothetical protein